MNSISEVTLSYMAGFIDGEGYIGIVRHKKIPNRLQSDSWLYHPYLIITSTDKKVIEDLHLVVDMGKQVIQRRTGVWKDAYQLKIANHHDLILLLKLLVPYLRIKKNQAELLVRFCEERKNKVIETGRGSRGKISFDKLDEEYYLQLRKLNCRGKTNE